MIQDWRHEYRCLRCESATPEDEWDHIYQSGFCTTCVQIILDAAADFIRQIEEAEREGKLNFLTKH